MTTPSRKKLTGKRLNIPIMTLLAASGGVLLLVFLASSYLLSTNLSTNAVHKITDQVLTQSAKTAQQIFDDKIVFAYLDLQTLGMSHALVTAAENRDNQAISEALQNIYKLGSGNSVYNILFYQSVEDDLLVDESFSAKKNRERTEKCHCINDRLSAIQTEHYLV